MDWQNHHREYRRQKPEKTEKTTQDETDHQREASCFFSGWQPRWLHILDMEDTLGMFMHLICQPREIMYRLLLRIGFLANAPIKHALHIRVEDMLALRLYRIKVGDSLC